MLGVGIQTMRRNHFHCLFRTSVTDQEVFAAGTVRLPLGDSQDT